MTRPLLELNEFIPVEYNYKLDVNHAKPNFTGEATIKLQHTNKNRTDDGTLEIVLNSSELIIMTASIDGERLSISYEKHSNRVCLRSNQQHNETELVLKLSYMGKINLIQTYKDATQGLYKTNYLDNISGQANNFILATQFQPNFASRVFPIIEDLNHKFNINLEMVTNKKFHVLCNGDLKESIEIDESTKLSRFSFPKPIYSSILSFIIGDLEYLSSFKQTINNEIGSIKVYTMIGESKNAQLALKYIETYLPKLEDVFGKFPLNHLYFVALPFLNDGAVENWGIINVLQDKLLLDETTASEEEKTQLKEIVIHELVHQWVGNWVSFDDWNCLWFNEAFATWVAKYVCGEAIDYDRFMNEKDCYYNEVKEEFEVKSITEHMRNLKMEKNSTIASIFSPDIYEKGLILLQMINSIFECESKNFLNCFKELVLEHFKDKTISFSKIWEILNVEVSIDLPKFVQAWCTSNGFPILSVVHKNDKLVITQNLYLEDSSTEIVNSLNRLFEIPILIRTRSNEVKLILMTERELELDPSDLISINADHKGYYKVIYDQLPDPAFISSKDLITVFNDLNDYISNWSSSSESLLRYFKLLEQTMQLDVSWQVWEVALNYYQNYLDCILHFNNDIYEKIQDWIQQYNLKLYKKFTWDSLESLTSSDYDTSEMKVRSVILQLNNQNPKAIKIATRLFQNFLNPSINKSMFIPKELLSGIFNCSMRNCSMNEYKRVLNYTKNADVSNLNITDLASPQELQTISLCSLSYNLNKEMVNKTLNFVNNNIDSKLIELGLLGFTILELNSEVLETLFNWLNVNYPMWVKKSLRKGSDWSKQIGITSLNILKIFMKIMSQNSHFSEKFEMFLTDKERSLPKHGLSQFLENWKHENQINLKIASYSQELVNL